MVKCWGGGGIIILRGHFEVKSVAYSYAHSSRHLWIGPITGTYEGKFSRR